MRGWSRPASCLRRVGWRLCRGGRRAGSTGGIATSCTGRSSGGKGGGFEGETRTGVEGPVGGAGELVAGFWIWKVEDMDEAVAWVKRCPNPMPGPSVIEIRPIMEFADLEENFTPEMKERRERVSEKLSGTLGPAGALGGLGS